MGAWHIKAAMDPAVAVVDDKDLLRVLLGNDRVLSRAAAMAVGTEDLIALVSHFVKGNDPVKAARAEWASAATGSLHGTGASHSLAALALLARGGGDTTEAQQLELTIRLTNVAVFIEEQKDNMKRIGELIGQKHERGVGARRGAR